MTNTMPTADKPANAKYIARLGTIARWITTDPGSMETVCAEMRKENGGGIPTFEPAPADAPVALPATLAVQTVQSGVSATGKARSQADYEAAVKAGFAPKMPLFERGTRVNSTGVENATRERQAWEAMPLVVDYCNDFTAQIASEERKDMSYPLADVRMAGSGRLALGRARFLLEGRGLVGLAARLGCGGGGTYLTKCDPELRAININRQCKAYGEKAASDHAINVEAGETDKAYEPEPVVLRTRKAGEGRSVFAAVSESYTPFDVDKVAEAIGQATPKDARGTVAYDGQKARFEVTFHSNVKPEDYVAGEFFSAAAVIETADDGSGSIKVSAAIKQNLCLNLIILDNAVTKIANIRHTGSVEKLAAKFRTAFEKAIKLIEPFMARWTDACQDDALLKALVASGQREVTDETATDVRNLLPGLFDAVLERDLVPVKNHGRKREAIVSDLLTMYDKDCADGSSAVRGGIVSRAAVCNAFTRYAHEVEGAQFDPFEESEIERAAGRLLNDVRPMPWQMPKWIEEPATMEAA